MRKSHAYYNIKARLDKDDSVCVNGSAVTSPRVGRLSSWPEWRFCGWTWPLTSFCCSFLFTWRAKYPAFCALSGIISRRWIPEDVSLVFHCQKPPRLQQKRNKFSCTPHMILKSPLRNASSQQLGYVNWLWIEYMNNWCVVANLSGRRKTVESGTKKRIN